MLKQISLADFIHLQTIFGTRITTFSGQLITSETSKNAVHEGKKLKRNQQQYFFFVSYEESSAKKTKSI